MKEAKLIEKPTKYIKCSCGEEIPITKYTKGKTCSCNRAYRRDNGKLVYDGMRCIACGLVHKKLYKPNDFCKYCTNRQAKYLKDRIEEHKRELKIIHRYYRQSKKKVKR